MIEDNEYTESSSQLNPSMEESATLKQRIRQREEELFQQVLKELCIEPPMQELGEGSTFSLDTGTTILTGIEARLIDLATDLKKQGKIDQCKRIIETLKCKFKTTVTLLGGEKII